VARLFRFVGAGMVLAACLAVMFGPTERLTTFPPGVTEGYPLVMADLLAAYGLLLGHRSSLVIAALVLACWLAAAGWQVYCSLRLVVLGLDYLILSLALF